MSLPPFPEIEPESEAEVFVIEEAEPVVTEGAAAIKNITSFWPEKTKRIAKAMTKNRSNLFILENEYCIIRLLLVILTKYEYFEKELC